MSCLQYCGNFYVSRHLCRPNLFEATSTTIATVRRCAINFKHKRNTGNSADVTLLRMQFKTTELLYKPVSVFQYIVLPVNGLENIF